MRENRLRDPTRVTVADVRWYVDNPGIFVWVEDQGIVGFSAADPRNGNAEVCRSDARARVIEVLAAAGGPLAIKETQVKVDLGSRNAADSLLFAWSRPARSSASAKASIG